MYYPLMTSYNHEELACKGHLLYDKFLIDLYYFRWKILT